MSEKTRHIVPRFEVKSLDDVARTFTGLASTWDLDLGGDVIEQGAFKRTLKNWKQSKRILPLLDSHNGGSVRAVVGKMESAEETDAGLLADFQVIEGPDGEEVFRRVAGGYADGLSIGYSPVKVRYPETEEEKNAGIWRYLTEVKLHEISVCVWPMNPNARIDVSTAKAMLAAAHNEDLDEHDRAELKSLAVQITALLGSDTPEPAPETLAKLEERIRRLDFRRLVTRIDAARHSGGVVLTT